MLRINVLSGLSICLAGILAVTGLMVATATDTRVADAAMAGDKNAVRSLLTQAVDVNSAQGDGMTALHWAALKGDAELAQLLIYAGANIKATTRLGAYTPLYMAAKTGSAPVIEVLLKAGADPKARSVVEITPLHMAATSGHVEAVRLLLDKGADPNAKEGESGQTPLSFAAAFNRSDVIKLLVDRGADLNLATKARQPVQQQRGQVPGQQFQQGQQQGQQGAQAAGAAPGRGIPQVPGGGGGRGGRGGRGGGEPPAAPAAAATAGAASAPAQAPQAAGQQAQQQGQQAQQGQQQQQQNNGGEDNSRGGGNQWGALTPLMYATRQGSFDAVRAIVESGKANLNLYSADGSTALVLATINGNFDIAKYLVEKGADPRIANSDGATPLYVVTNTQWAKKSFYPQPTARYEKTTYLELMNLLMDKGADPNAKLTKDLWYSEYNFSLSSASAAGSTAFWKCAEVGDIDGMKLLMSRGADPNIANNTGVTPLLIASGAGTHGNDDVVAPPGRLAAVKYLVEELKADVNAKDRAPAGGGGGRGGNQNPQQLRDRAIEVAKQLTNGATPTEEQIQEQLRALQQQQGGFGRGRSGGITALHNAAARGDNEMILYLVSKGAKVDAVSESGVSVVDLANGPRQRVQPYPETVALLEILGAKNSHKCVSC